MKTAETNPLYQSRILPIVQHAETRIKTLILLSFLFGKPKLALLTSVLNIIKSVQKQIPDELGDVSTYVNGLVARSDFYIKEYYDKPQTSFLKIRTELQRTNPAARIDNAKQLYDLASHPRDLWAEAKASPNVANYPTELKKTIARLSESPMTVQEPGKKPISVWQKAELDTRYENQMQMLQDLRVKGEDLCWISSHVDCSKRCEPWQGKLVSLEKHGDANFVVGTVDGHTVYSLPDIMAQVDKYGYHNNIICGFNCRHRLIPYRKGTVAPKEYKKGEIAKQRSIEGAIRERERQIRLYKTNEHLYNESGITPPTIKGMPLKKYIKGLESSYKAFCEKHGYAWQEYRIKI